MTRCRVLFPFPDQGADQIYSLCTVNLKPYPYFKDPDALLEFMSEGREIRDQRQTKDGSISRRIAK